MKKFILAFVMYVMVFGTNYARENQQNNSYNLYTLFLNVVNEQFRFPLIGFVNIAEGNHSLPQIGFVNWNQNNFSGLQLGFINTVVGNMDGLQIGFVNTAVNGIGGVQLSFINITKHLNGVQLGFINYVDSIEQGIPVGFLSIVRKGGYQAVESGVSVLSPFNISLKIGIEQSYTSFVVSYNPFGDSVRKQIILGTGVGTIIRLNEKFFINPEIISHNAISESFQYYLDFVPYFGYTIIPNLSIVAGPSVVWAHTDKDTDRIFYTIGRCSINDNNKLYFGAKVAVRFSW